MRLTSIESRASDTLQIALWAIATLAVGCVLFWTGVSQFNQQKILGNVSSGALFMLVPVIGQIVWLAGAAIFSRMRHRREPIIGAFVGVAVEIAVVLLLLLYSASAHY